MDYRSRVNSQDKLEVMHWFEKYCPTSKHARTRENILPFILIHKNFESAEAKDRYFRRIVHELIHEGHLCSHNSKGYWFKPLWTTDKEELKAIKMSLLERKSKALAMIADVDWQLNQLEDSINRQQEFSLKG